MFSSIYLATFVQSFYFQRYGCMITFECFFLMAPFIEAERYLKLTTKTTLRLMPGRYILFRFCPSFALRFREGDQLVLSGTPKSSFCHHSRTDRDLHHPSHHLHMFSNLPTKSSKGYFSPPPDLPCAVAVAHND